VVPFGDFGVCEDRVVGTGDSGGEAASDVVVGRVDSFAVSGGVVLILPIAVLCWNVLAG
jgi:hypothetical protein